jgi:hypothetical protein
MDDLLGDLARLRHYATGLQELMDELQQASPERSEGSDRSGMVHAVYGRDGLPESIRVSPYWKEKLQPAGFAAAVVGACQAAATQRGTEWSRTLSRAGWQERADRLDQDSARAAASDPNPVPPAFRRPGSGSPTPPRPIPVLAEEAIGLLDLASSPSAWPSPEPAKGSGGIRGGSLTITLVSGGQISCQADPHWVAQRSGAQLTEAIGEALAAARRELASAAGSVADRNRADTARADRLVEESIAVIEDAGRQGS